MSVPRRSKKGTWGGGAAAGGIALLGCAIASFGALVYFYFSVPAKPVLDPVSLCPVDGARGVTVVLVDTSDDLKQTTQREVLTILEDQITTLPEYHNLDIRVLDIAGARSRSLFAKCNPGEGAGLSEWTANPRIARLQWIESFMKPAREAVKSSLASAKARSSPIMGALQDIALAQFSTRAAQDIPKALIVISDMLEFTSDYSQYPSAGDLSYQRFRQSRAYAKFWTDLHGARITIQYVIREQPKIDTVRHMQFWREWIADNKGTFVIMHRLQGAN